MAHNKALIPNWIPLLPAMCMAKVNCWPRAASAGSSPITALDLLIDQEKGIWHLANKGAYTWAQLAELAAAIAKIQDVDLQALPVADLHLPAFRPQNTVLNTVKGDLMPTVEDALYRCVHHWLLEMEQSNTRLEPVDQVPKKAGRVRASSTGTD